MTTDAPAAISRQPWWVTPDRAFLTSWHPAQQRLWGAPNRELGMIAGSGGGKALAVDTPIPTPAGFRPIGDLMVGDTVYDDQGVETLVTYVSPVYLDHVCYRLIFDDGSAVVADAGHRWVTQTAAQRKNASRRRPANDGWTARRPQCRPTADEGVVTTEEIASSLVSRRGATNHSIRLAPPFQGAAQSLPIPPYTLGAWLGDGTSLSAAITSADPEILDFIRADGVGVGPPKECNSGLARSYRLGGGERLANRDAMGRACAGDTLQGKLRLLGVLGNKHIPEVYQLAPAPDRLALLQGLMDTDGYCPTKGNCELTFASPRLARDAQRLIAGLRIKVFRGRHHSGAVRLTFTTDDPVFRLSRKLDRVPLEVRPSVKRRFIVGCERIESVPVRCIAVSAPSRQFLCTESFISTHNTAFGAPWLYWEARSRPGEDFIAMEPTWAMVARVMLPEFRKLTRACGGEVKRSEQYVEVYNSDGPPSRIWLASAENPERIEGIHGSGAWCDEAGQYSSLVFETIRRRCALRKGRILWSSTPYDLGALKVELYDRWASGDPHYRVVQFASTANPSYPAEEMERARATMPAWRFAMFHLGQFTRPENLIYGDYLDTPRHEGGHLVADFDIPAEWPRYAGVDFGAVNTATLWVAHDPAANVFYAYHETLEGGKTTAEHVAAFNETAARGNYQMALGGAPGEQQQRWDWGAAGAPVQKPYLGEVEQGIDRVIGLIKTRRLFVFESLRGLRAELGSYSRVMSAEGVITEKIKDKETFHRLDSLRYVSTWLAYIDGTKPEEKAA